MRELVRGNADKALKGAFSCNKSKHSIFHPPISPLNNRILFIRIKSYGFIEKNHKLSSYGLNVFPIRKITFLVFIKKMKIYVVWARINFMNKIRISSPGKIMYFWCYKMPRDFFFLFLLGRSRVTMTNLFRILNIPTCSNNIIFINRYFHIIITPNTMELPSQIGLGIPTIVIIFSHFRKPLSHGKSDPIVRIPSGASNHYRNLTFKIKS